MTALCPGITISVFRNRGLWGNDMSTDGRALRPDKARRCCRVAAVCLAADAKRQIYEMALQCDGSCGEAHAGLTQVYRHECESWMQAAAQCRQDGAGADIVRHCEEQAAKARGKYEYHGNMVMALLRSES